MAAHLRDETESAGAIAPLGNFDKRVVAWRRQHPGRRLVVEVCRALLTQRNYRERPRLRLWITDSENVIDLTRPDESIVLGQIGFQLVSITLDQTAGDD